MSNQTNAPNLPSLMSAQYSIANTYLGRGFMIKGGIFLLNVVFIFIPQLSENNIAVWCIFGISVAAIVLDNNYQEKYRSSYETGEKIRKLDLIRKVFPAATNKAEEAYILSQITAKVINLAKKNPKDETKYYTDQPKKLQALAEHIQENSFWTSSLMDLHSKMIKNYIILMFVMMFVSVVGGFYVVSEYAGQGELINLNVSQYLALLVNTVFAFNLLTYYNTFRKKANQLASIDQKIETTKKSIELDSILIDFAEYNCILCDAYPTADAIYKAHGDRLNAAWEMRVDND